MKQKLYLLLLAILPIVALAESVPTGSGTKEEPFNAAAANAYVRSLDADVVPDADIYIKGTVSSIKNEFTTKYGNATFYISDDGSSDGETFYVYRTLYLGNREYQEGDRQIEVGDEVIVCGKVVNYQGNVPETKEKRSYIYALREKDDANACIDGIYYKLHIDNTAEVTNGMVVYTGDVSIPETISHEEVTYTVNAITDDAFSNANSLTSITIPSTISKVGKYAFHGCEGLTAVHINDLVSWCNISFENYYANPLFYAHQLFLNGEEVKEIVVSSDVKRVGDYAFYGCTSITSFKMMEDGVTYIGLAAFKGCTNLSEVYLLNSILTIRGSAFSGCSNLKSVQLSNQITSLMDYIFKDCIKLVHVGIPEGVTSIGSHVFDGCSNMTKVTCAAQAIPSTNEGTFANFDRAKAKLYVRGDAITEYQNTSPWKEFGSFSIIAGTEIPHGSGTLEDPYNPTAAIDYIKSLGVDVVSDKDVYIKGIICGIENTFSTRYGNATFYISETGEVPNHKIYAYRALYVGNRNFVTGDEQIRIGDEVIICGKVKWYQGTKFETVEKAAYIYSLNGKTATASTPTGNGTMESPFNAAAANSYIRGLSPNVVSTDDIYIKGKVCAINDEFTVETNNASFYLSDDGTTSGDLFYAYRTHYIANKDFTADDRQIAMGDEVVVCGKVVLYQGTIPETKENESYILSMNGTAVIEVDGNSYSLDGSDHTAEFKSADNTYTGEVTIPSEVTCGGTTYQVSSISSSAFYGCSGLTAVTIPESIVSIGEQAFFGCDGLTSITSNISEPFAIYNVFPASVLTSATLYVPYMKKTAYQATVGWRDFSNIVEQPGGDVITLTAKNYEREYGEENPTFEYAVTGGTADGNAVITCDATANSPAGTYPIIVSRGDVANTYATFVEGTLTITKAPLTVTAKSYTRKEGEDNPSFELTYTGWKLSETESVLTVLPVATTDATKDSPAGEYVITVNGGSAQNYTFNYVNGTLTIEETSGIVTINGDGNPFDVYTINGIKVRTQVTSLEGLPKGLYIVNGRKVTQK